jgi:hypothetical protein
MERASDRLWMWMSREHAVFSFLLSIRRGGGGRRPEVRCAGALAASQTDTLPPPSSNPGYGRKMAGSRVLILAPKLPARSFSDCAEKDNSSTPRVVPLTTQLRPSRNRLSDAIFAPDT